MLNENSRKLWKAIILHFITPGLGQFYYGKLLNGLIIFISIQISGIIIMLFSVYFENFMLLLLSLVLPIFIWLFSLIQLIVKRVSYSSNFISRSYNNHWYNYLLAFVIAILFNIGVYYSKLLEIGEISPIRHNSMENTILDKDYIFFKNIFSESIKDNDIIAIDLPTANGKAMKIIKRCIARENETIEIRNKDVYVNGKLIPFPKTAIKSDTSRNYLFSIADSIQFKKDNMPLTEVPKGYIFVLGDNRDHSIDSRNFGVVDKKNVRGKALFIVYSLHGFTTEGNTAFERLAWPFSKNMWRRSGIRLCEYEI